MFEVELTYPALVRAKVVLDANDERQAEVAVIALLHADPQETNWQILRPPRPEYKARVTRMRKAKRG